MPESSAHVLHTSGHSPAVILSEVLVFGAEYAQIYRSDIGQAEAVELAEYWAKRKQASGRSLFLQYLQYIFSFKFGLSKLPW